MDPKFSVAPVALEWCPEPLRDLLVNRVRRLGPADWTTWGRKPAPSADVIGLLATEGACTRSRVTAWADIGPWDPGRLVALRFRWGLDGETAVAALEAPDGFPGQPSLRLVVLAEIPL